MAKKLSVKVSKRTPAEPDETAAAAGYTQSSPPPCTAIADHTPDQFKEAKESGSSADPLLPTASVRVSKRESEESDESAVTAGYTQSGPLTAIADHTPAQRRQEEELKQGGEGPEPLLPLDD